MLERATAILIDPCTGALGATSYWISIAAALPGRRSYVGALGTGGLGGSRQIGPCDKSTPLDPSLDTKKGTGWVELFAKPITARAKRDGYRFRSTHPTH